MNRKPLIILVTLAIVTVFLVPILAKENDSVFVNGTEWSQSAGIDSNFYGQEEDKRTVQISETPELDLVAKGYNFLAETEDLELYIKERYFNIAVYDKTSGYIWYSVYPEYLDLGYSGASRFFLESGIILEYYNLDNILIDDSKSYLSGQKYNVSIEYDYESVPNGVKAHVVFNDLAISFDVLVWIEADQLKLSIPYESIEEGDIEKDMLNLDGTISTKIISYRIKAIYLFPYFGSNNYEINGYSFIPDGSGALIRYGDDPKSTAYIKRLYGGDEGYRMTDTEDDSHLKEEFTASMPVFGVAHGYRQAAFLAHVKMGSTVTEIHSYPYGYNSYPLNTTFAKFIYRERYQITTSNNERDSFQLINEEPFPVDFAVDYHFLSGDEADYSGMAKCYREILGLEKTENASPKMTLSFIGLDYKKGLFGKNYVSMTDYTDVVDILETLGEKGITQCQVDYLGWSKGGYYDNTPVKPVVSGILGGKTDFKELVDYLDSLGIELYVRDNPILSFSGQLGNRVVKKITLMNFITDADSSRLIDQAYYRDPGSIADNILDNMDEYQELSIDSFSFAGVGQAVFSYRYKNENHTREAMMQLMIQELAQLEAYNLAMPKANSYIWPYLSLYQEIPIESNKYSYITDSVPFIQLVLSGSVAMSSPYVNFVSDYGIFALRLIEYNVMPAFLLTEEPTYKLRYTNFEYVYTSEFAIWEETIEAIYNKVYSALEQVNNREMTRHSYVFPGVAKIEYGDDVTLYVNYTANKVFVVGGVVEAMDYLVVNGS